jgi:Co/Zn/Cd efflux system component
LTLRLSDEPPASNFMLTMLVALVGLGVNLVSMKLLAGGSSESLNVKGAYFEPSMSENTSK